MIKSMKVRKCIKVPKDKIAERALSYGDATPDQLLEVYIADDEFDELWEAGVFTTMNEITGAMIDYFESAKIVERKQLEQVLTIAFKNGILIDKLDRIKVLFQEALNRGTGVYFFF